jgi:hypothetical protein
VTQQQRNRRLKDLACAVGLERPFAYVRFYQGKPKEEVGPLWKYSTTHTARHTGADMVLWGSGGNQDLKELALGHLAGASVYGYDTLKRYGPKLLQAWDTVLAEMHPKM